MGLIERSNVVLVPATVTPHGHTSPLFNRLLYGHHTGSHQVFRNRPNTNICEESVQSTKVPPAMLGRANFVIWQTTHPKEFFGGSTKQWTHIPITTSPLGWSWHSDLPASTPMTTLSPHGICHYNFLLAHHRGRQTSFPGTTQRHQWVAQPVPRHSWQTCWFS